MLLTSSLSMYIHIYVTTIEIIHIYITTIEIIPIYIYI